MSDKINCTYVSQKISKIRWRPSTLGDPRSFITGSWNDDKNRIRLWDAVHSVVDDNDDLNTIEKTSLPFSGNITELKFINADHFIASSSDGSVYLLKITVNETGEVDICEDITWRGLHRDSPCTSVASYDNDIASVGEDGQISLLTTTHKEPMSILANADSCTINCVEFLRYNELLTSNSQGLMKIWDLRQDKRVPIISFILHTDEIAAVTCLGLHPTQRHILATGDERGALTFWDLRQPKYPLNSITSHAEAVSELRFHPDRPEHVFTCSEAGEVFHWSGTRHTEQLWYTAPTGSNKFEISQLMPKLHVPLNTLDLSMDRLLCGADNEAIYLIDKVNIYA